MKSVTRSRFFRSCFGFLFFGAAVLVGFYGLLLLVESFNGHGSDGGNALLFVLGFILLLLSSGTFVVGAVCWMPKSNIRPARSDYPPMF
jgi:hypothetical protein